MLLFFIFFSKFREKNVCPYNNRIEINRGKCGVLASGRKTHICASRARILGGRDFEFRGMEADDKHKKKSPIIVIIVIHERLVEPSTAHGRPIIIIKRTLATTFCRGGGESICGGGVLRSIWTDGAPPMSHSHARTHERMVGRPTPTTPTTIIIIIIYNTGKKAQTRYQRASTVNSV